MNVEKWIINLMPVLMVLVMPEPYRFVGSIMIFCAGLGSFLIVLTMPRSGKGRAMDGGRSPR